MRVDLINVIDVASGYVVKDEMILCMPKLVKKGKDTHERQIMAHWPYGCHRRIYVVRWHT